MLDDFRPRRKPAPVEPRPMPEPVTPDEPTELDTVDPPDPPLAAPAAEPVVDDTTKKKNNFIQKLRSRIRRPRNKKEWAILVATVLIVIGGLSGGAYALYKSLQPEPVQQVVEPPPPAPEPPPEPTTVAAKLTGLQVEPELNKRPITGIMIENSPSARPQSGLKDAEVVFEAVAEGGITRFLALFHINRPQEIGPVRSARPYYVDWVAGFDAGYGHVGGSPEGLAHLRNIGVKDLDQFGNPGAYWRSSARYAPHNMYTSMDRLDELNKSKGYTSSNFAGFARYEDEAPAETPTAKTIDIALSSYLYNVHYDYDPASNSYKRVLGGQPHVDAPTGQQIAPKVIVAMVMAKGRNGIYSTYNTIGSGEAIIFHNGEYASARWEKTSSKEPLKFTNAEGKPFKLAPGQTWITAVGSPAEVTHAP